jgi:hypothetical protein
MRGIVLLAFVLAQLPAQTSPVVAALQAGDVARALELLDGGATPGDDALRLQAVRLLTAVPHTEAKLRERALRWAVQILPATVSQARAAEHKAAAREAGSALARVLMAQKDVLVDGRVTDRNHLGAGVAALAALRSGGAAHSEDTLALGLHLAPLLLAGERARDAVNAATAAMEASPSSAQAIALHGLIATGQLQLGRPAQARPHAKAFVQADPGNAETVLPLARAFPAGMADEVFPMLGAVVRRRPRQEAQAAWTTSLAEFYAAAERLRAKKTTANTVADLVLRMPLPQTWHQVLWGEGYRIWRDPDARPAKIASGKDALLLPVPQSVGWHRREQPPDDLQRWNNAAYCVQRGEAGPTLVVYWFGPNLEFWYGDTPVERGVTGKTVRGHSAGAIARMVFDVVYGEDAKRRGVKITPRAALPFALPEAGFRRTFAAGDVIYDETVFAHGSVAIEVLLRVTQAQLAELEPELRWMYENLRKE